MNSHVCQMFQYCSECKKKVCHICHYEHQCACGSWSPLKICEMCRKYICRYCIIYTDSYRVCKTCLPICMCKKCGKRYCGCKSHTCGCGDRAVRLCICGRGLCLKCANKNIYCEKCKKCDICEKSTINGGENCRFCNTKMCKYCQNRSIDYFYYCDECEKHICTDCGHLECKCYNVFTDRRPIIKKKLITILMGLRAKLPRNLILLICEQTAEYDYI